MRAFPGRFVRGLVVVASTAGTGSAFADPSSADAAAARSLFDEARALVAAGRAAEACPKLEESQRLDPGSGTLFNLADCYARVGKTASAWSMFLQVASQEKAARRPEREQAARQRATDLAPQLSKLTIVVPSASDLPGLEVRRDGATVGRGSWGSAVAVDPGDHSVDASAPGRKNWQTKVTVKGPAGGDTVTVPALEEQPAATSSGPPAPAVDVTGPVGGGKPAAAQSPQRDEAPGSNQRLLGYGAAGLGVAGLVVGTVFGLRKGSKQDEAKSHCQDYPNLCDASGLSANDEASRAATVAMVGFIGGGAFLAAGVVLVLTAPSADVRTAKGVQLAPVLDQTGRGIQLQGVW